MSEDTITRLELAPILKLSPDALRKSEANLGLKICREKTPSRQVHYRRRDAERILRALGFRVQLSVTSVNSASSAQMR